MEAGAISCVRVPEARGFPPELVGICAGAGEEGIGDMSTLAGKVVYAFGHRRVRPYASGGVAFYRVERWSAEILTHGTKPVTASVYQLVSRRTGLGPSMGGGAWIDVAYGVSIRPAAELLIADGASNLRASAGMNYGW
jgi:hypothetical protein